MARSTTHGSCSTQEKYALINKSKTALKVLNNARLNERKKEGEQLTDFFSTQSFWAEFAKNC